MFMYNYKISWVYSCKLCINMAEKIYKLAKGGAAGHIAVSHDFLLISGG